MRDVITLVLAGIGGYGRMYLKHLLDAPSPRNFRIVGVAEPLPHRFDRMDDVARQGIPVYESLESFYETHTADLAVIATPVHLHSAHILLALSHGSHVLCEKPLASSMDDVRQLLAARDAAHRHVAIGYQWSYSPAIRQLKRDVASGLLGAPRRMRTLVLWPRGESYYQRNAWAGKVSDANGAPVLDSPLHNACAHFVHNMFYVLGEKTDRAAFPTSVTAELYRANDIENYDTATVRCTINGGVEALIVASHAVPLRNGPVFSYEFDDAVVTYDDAPDGSTGGEVIARFKDGREKNYGRPCSSDDPTKLWHTMDCARNGQVPICGIEASAGQTALVVAAQHSVREIGQFPHESIVSEEGPNGRLLWVRDLADELRRCYDTMQLPSEAGFAWAVAGRRVAVDRPEIALAHAGVNGHPHHDGATIPPQVFVARPSTAARRPLTEPI